MFYHQDSSDTIIPNSDSSALNVHVGKIFFGLRMNE